MTPRQFTVASILALLAAGLASMLALFAARVDVIAAEGNDLRTVESVWVTASLEELNTESKVFGTGTRAFVDVEPAVRAVAILRGDWRDVPLHGGRPLSGAEDEALVGGGREISGDTIDVGGKDYRVVGRLGLGPASFLADDVVIADRSRFSAGRERLRLDGPDVAARYRDAFPDRRVEQAFGGVNERTNVDLVSPVLLALGSTMVVAISVLAALLSVGWLTGVARVRHLTGRSRGLLATGVMLRAGSVLIAPALISITSVRAMSDALYVRSAGFPAVAAVAAVMLTTIAVAAVARSRRWS
jgi:hypothetical protein